MININQYINLEERYALFGKNGYYLSSLIVKKMIVDELKNGMTFQEIEDFMKNFSNATEEDISAKNECYKIIQLLNGLSNLKFGSENTLSKEQFNDFISKYQINNKGEIYCEDAILLVEEFISQAKKILPLTSNLIRKKTRKN